MAKSLINTLKQASGQLATGSAEELAAQTGRAQAPITPQETKVVGGTAQQAAMAGSPEQKGSALRQALQKGEDLATTQREGQTRTTATADESAEAKKAASLQGLGSLGDRVQQLANQTMVKAAQTAPSTLAAATPDQSVLLAKVAANPNDHDALIQLNKAVGNTDINQLLTADQLKAKFQPVTETTAQQVAAATPDQITADKLDFTTLGFPGGTKEVAAVLGVTEEQLKTMNVNQLMDTIHAQTANEMAGTEELKRKLSDPNIGPAERAEAAQTLREQGAVGVASAESNMEDLNKKINNADTVTFNGQSTPIADLLSDQNISDTVSNYFNDPAAAEELKKNEPDFSKFLDQHAAALTSALDKIGQGATGLAAQQQQHLDLAHTAVGEINSDVMKSLIPSFGKVTAEQGNVPTILKEMKDPNITPQVKQSMMQAMTSMQQVHPEYMTELSKLDAHSLIQLGFEDVNSKQYKDTIAYLDRAKAVQNINPHDASQVAGLAGFASAKDMAATLQEAQKRAATGLFPANKASQELIKMGPNKPLAQWNDKDWDQFGVNLKASQLNDKGKAKGLSELAAHGAPRNLLEDGQAAKKATEKDNKVYSLLKSGIDASAPKQSVTADKLAGIAGKASLQDLELLAKDKTASTLMTAKAQAQLGTYVAKKLEPSYNEIASISGTFKDAGSLRAILAGAKTTVPSEKVSTDAHAYLETVKQRLDAANKTGNTLQAAALKEEVNKTASLVAQYDKTQASSQAQVRTVKHAYKPDESKGVVQKTAAAVKNTAGKIEAGAGSLREKLSNLF